jgi:galactose mutarotase-like enzyme
MILLESDRARVEIDPAFGARVTALWDKRSGREWLVTGPREGEASDTAPYGGAQARGWDECFPTVFPCRYAAWGNLRDHGLLWGRPWAVLQHGATAYCNDREERLTFRRTLDLHGATLHALHEVESHAEEPLPWMWAQHALLAARPGERIRLEGVGDITAGGRSVSWPHHDGRDLSVVGTPEHRVPSKLYARAAGAVRAMLEGPKGGIAFAWDNPGIRAMGLWLDWGGWPEDAPVHQLAIEPTTTPADDLPQAEAHSSARSLAPGATAARRMTVALTDPS